MTLFHRAAPDEPAFRQMLERFYGGVADEATDALIGWDETPTGEPMPNWEAIIRMQRSEH